MGRLQLIRYDLQPNHTKGTLCYGDWSCCTLEDTVRDINKDGDLDDYGEGKVYGRTAIPYGKYKYYKAKSPKRGYDVIWIEDVDGFKWVQIHPGNTVYHSKGCILVGYRRDGDKIYESKKAFEDLMKLVPTKGEIHII